VIPKLNPGDLFVVLRGPATMIGHDRSYSDMVWKTLIQEGDVVAVELMAPTRSWKPEKRISLNLNEFIIQPVTEMYLKALLGANVDEATEAS
jgi:hypothetical protein